MSVDRITQKLASSLLPGQTVWDETVKGFGIRKQRKAAVYVFKYRHQGKQKFLTIGRHGSPWSPETARLEARRHLYGLVHGSKCDPAGLRDSLNSEPTLAIFAGRYLAEYAAIRKKPRSVREDRRNLALHILPSLGSFKLSEIGRGDVIRLHAAQHARPVNANRCLSLISHIFTVAEKWDLSPPNSNPCRGIERYREISRERFLTTAELRRLGAALESASRGYQDAAWEEFAPSQRLMRTGPEDWRAVACYRLLLFTGARLSEILSLRWSWIDRERGLARLPDSKTGAKTLTLPQPALACLKQIKERVQERYPGTPFVLPGDRSGGHFKGIQAPWQRIRLLAGLADVRIHDLRHAYASTAVSGGDSLYIVGAILGHRHTATTQRYAHLARGPVQEAADRTAGKIASLLDHGTMEGERWPLPIQAAQDA